MAAMRQFRRGYRCRIWFAKVELSVDLDHDGVDNASMAFAHCARFIAQKAELTAMLEAAYSGCARKLE